MRGTHLVHPGATVKLVTTKDETSLSVYSDLDVEAFITHFSINLRARIPLSKLDPISMSLQYLMHHFDYSNFLRWLALLYSFLMQMRAMVIPEMQFYRSILKEILPLVDGASGTHLRNVAVFDCL